ncbi:hypothetical protein FHG87_005291 [Trinorchestia longiramus]|nr:hypothetical protein FHG87_005291 [Trinorchestia longiramus]
MSGSSYRKFVEILKAWPVDQTKIGGRDLGEYIRHRLSTTFRLGAATSVDEEKCGFIASSLLRISKDKYKEEYTEQKLPSNKRTNRHLSHSQATHIKLAALVIEAHIASLVKTESYGSILSKSLKRNFNIDTSFPDRDSQKIFNLFINPNLEPAPLATSNTNTGTVPTHHDMESESEQSSTETNDKQNLNYHGKHTQRRKPQRKERKPALLPINTCELEATLVKSATQQPPILTHPTNEWIITELSKNNPKIEPRHSPDKHSNIPQHKTTTRAAHPIRPHPYNSNHHCKPHPNPYPPTPILPQRELDTIQKPPHHTRYYKNPNRL